MLILSISDLHLGKGKFLKNGQVNLLEDFFEDERFYEFCDYFSSGEYFEQEVHLVLNGDILNLIQIDVEGVFTHIVDEELTIKAIDSIYRGHPRFFLALKKFMQSPNKKVTFIIGNHDAALGFDGAKEHLISLIHPQVEVVMDMRVHGVHIEHGHRFEAINTVPPHRYFIKGPLGKKILNLPWGSLFCINVLPQLKKYRPYFDKVRPMTSYIKWCFFHDFKFFIRLTRIVLKYLFETRFDNYTKQNRNFKTTIKILKQVTIYPRYAKKAKQILKQDHDLHTVVMGHTHLQEWRRFPEGKYYFNTGTWNSIPSIDAGLHQSDSHLTFCYLKIDKKLNHLIDGGLNVWRGIWKPFEQL